MSKIRFSLQSLQRTGYGLDDQRVRIRFPVGLRYYFLFYNVQTGSGAVSSWILLQTLLHGVVIISYTHG